MPPSSLRRKDKYARYMWLIDTIRRHDRCTLQEINRRWQQEETLNPDGAPLSRRTFQQHKEAINEMDFGIEIICTGNRYYSVLIDDHNPLGAWMWQTLSLRLMLSESKELNERIITEEIPSANCWLHPILSALRENRRLQITYRPFGKEEFPFLLSPYFVQMSDRRWYVFGLRDSETTLKAYALDRIQACKPSEKTFTLPETFSAGEYLRQHGIGQYDAITETKVVLEAYGQMADRLHTLPLHPSQQETKTKANKTEFTYTLRPTSRFFGELLACGAYVKVLSPQWVRHRLKETIDKISNYYK
ncbi:MAG: WYL domain-containing protein [Alistipes sp.]|uniref:helix-turn-helix transcriptional regulator n=1 Tax=Alistipes sp. TaxID=1872444 RepID=UPI0025C18831|nr:WYL domain-containing protein [Alistipes sp.]MCD8274631.1 WYL domain-containing protein [Alistipes sp.]